jgi:hypothetical protein
LWQENVIFNKKNKNESTTISIPSLHSTEVSFASFLSSGFTNLAVINPPENKLEKRTSLH